jgi:hypothetical protein
MKFIACSVVLYLIAGPVEAQYDQPSWPETTDEMSQRHEADLYDQYRARREQGRDWAPLGGYMLRSGEPLPYDTKGPGDAGFRRYDAYGTPAPSYR